MTAPAIDPPQAFPVPRRRTVRPMALAALKFALGAAGLAGVAAGAIWLVTEPAPPPSRSAVRLVKIEAWPEIKDGVPALAAPATAPVAPEPPVSESRVEPPAQIEAAPSAPPTVPPPAEQATMSAPSEAAGPAPTLPQTDLRATADSVDAAPLPPPAPRRTASDQAKPRKEQSPRAPVPRTAAAKAKPAPKIEEAAPPPAPATPASPPDERIKVFGVPLPNGRDIKNTFESIGDAMMGRANRS